MITTAIAAVFAMIYLTYMTYKAKQIPDSISETAYIANKKSTFTVAVMAFIALLWASLVQKCTTDTEYLAFLTAAGLVAVAHSPNYKNEHKIMHYGGGILSLIASQLIIYLNNSSDLLYTWGFFPLLTATSPKNWVFWAEIICLTTIFLFIL